MFFWGYQNNVDSKTPPSFEHHMHTFPQLWPLHLMIITPLLPHAPPSPPNPKSSPLLRTSHSSPVSLIISLGSLSLSSLPPPSSPFAVHGGVSSTPATLFRRSSLSTLSPPTTLPPSNSPPLIPYLLNELLLLRLIPPLISVVSASATPPSSLVTYKSNPSSHWKPHLARWNHLRPPPGPLVFDCC